MSHSCSQVEFAQKSYVCRPTTGYNQISSCFNRNVSSLHMRVFVLRKLHAARLFNDLIWWDMVEGYKCGLGLAGWVSDRNMLV